MEVKTCPIMEAISKALFGIETITDKEIKARMINNAVKSGKNAAECVYGGFDMMRSHRENAQLKGQNAMLCRDYNAMRRNSMSIDKVQEMSHSIMTMFAPTVTQEYANKFIKEWRKNNDC